ncbi:MAG: hypothetical protein JWL96_4092 [Sphingomonas bacterium]|uniref:DUF2490 domain-containing protein n=1 Tax=Sphingomonas bacterium TaxID=1895847 RepID=UPI00263A3404|nr:DUF2490 domain-containing protein [Sphingomonas bacterium]MDB5712022.1 hypothetical protein [Sphingomonas bacterium]
MRIALPLAVAGALFAVPAGADPVQPWPSVYVSAPIGGKWLGSVEIVGRVSDDERTRPSQVEARFQIGRAIDEHVTLWAGYVHVVSYNDGRRDGIEDQMVEQLNWRPGRVGPLEFSARTRLEQRFITGNDRTAWRVRAQARAMLPIGHSRVAAVLWAEPFVALNHTAATGRTFEQLRSFAGVSVRVSKRADVEFGYLNQRLWRVSGNVVNHAIPLVLNVRF